MMQYVKFESAVFKTLGPVINLGLMGLVWWAADKLTWDCTHLDEDRRASGRGVLAAAGLDQTAPDDVTDTDQPERPDGKKKRTLADGFVGWVERYQAFRTEQRKKPHTPGVWVLYFGLAALPVFALGQSLIDPNDTDRRRATFLQMAVYVGSALGLLVTTTLLGLRKYLEQRGANIPATMTAGWLGLGAGLIVAFLAVAALLPRPHSETAWFGISRAGGGKSDRRADKFNAVPDDSAGKGEGASGRKTEAGDGKGSAKGGQQGGGKSGQKGSGGGKGKDGGGEAKGGKQGGGKSDLGKGKSGDDQSDSKSQQQNDQVSDDQGRQHKKDFDGPNGGPQERQAKSPGSNQKSQDDQQKEAEDKTDSSSDQPSTMQKLLETPSKVLGFLHTVIKWVVYAAVVVVVIYCALRYGLGYLANFTDWASKLLDWWRSLFARKPGEGKEGAAEGPVDDGPRRPVFEDFSNPFADGTVRRRSPADVIAYTFAAFDAWAWERGRGRQPGETPTEFAIRVGHEVERLDEPGFRLAELYVRALYSKGPLPADALKAARAVWEQLEARPSMTVR
jgi:hypothetical protein